MNCWAKKNWNQIDLKWRAAWDGGDQKIKKYMYLFGWHSSMPCSPCKEGVVALKIDMGKAYDRLEWKILEDMMLKLEFHENWVPTVMGCVSTVSLSILHNEELGHIIPFLLTYL